MPKLNIWMFMMEPFPVDTGEDEKWTATIFLSRMRPVESRRLVPEASKFPRLGSLQR